MSKILWTIGMLAVGSAATSLSAEEFVLASAQVVESTDAAPVLKLTANGPIAFEIVPGGASSPDAAAVTIRLYGVHVAKDLSLDGLAPFSVTAVPLEDGCRVTVAIAAAPGSHLDVRSGARASELEVRTVTRASSPR